MDAKKVLSEIQKFCERETHRTHEMMVQQPEYLAYDKAVISTYAKVIKFIEQLKADVEDTTHLD